MHRARSFALVVVVAMVVSSWAGFASAKALPARQTETPIDLTALAIYPPDTGEDGYVVVDGKSCLTVADCADPVFFGAATEASLSEAGLVRAYALALARFSAEGAATRSLATTVAEYANPGGAGEGLKTFLSWLADPASEVPVSSRIGSGAQLFDLKDGLAGDPSATGVVGLRFRSGSIVVGIEIRDYSGDAPDRAEVEDLGRLVVELIKSEQTAETPGLGALVVHHRATATEFYPHRDGETIPLYQEGKDQFAARESEFSGAGIEDVFLSNQTLVTGDDPERPDVLLSVVLYSLSNAAGASAYLNDVSTAFAAQRERLGAPTAEPEDPPSVGDESVWYLNVYSDAYQAMGYVRVGNVVARVIWQRDQATAEGEEADRLQAAERELLPGAEYTAKAQVGCLEDGGCPGLTKLSSRFLP